MAMHYCLPTQQLSAEDEMLAQIEILEYEEQLASEDLKEEE